MESQSECEGDDRVGDDEAGDGGDALADGHVDGAHRRVQAEVLQHVGEDHDDADAFQAHGHHDQVVLLGAGQLLNAVKLLLGSLSEDRISL